MSTPCTRRRTCVLVHTRARLLKRSQTGGNLKGKVKTKRDSDKRKRRRGEVW